MKYDWINWVAAGMLIALSTVPGWGCKHGEAVDETSKATENAEVREESGEDGEASAEEETNEDGGETPSGDSQKKEAADEHTPPAKDNCGADWKDRTPAHASIGGEHPKLVDLNDDGKLDLHVRVAFKEYAIGWGRGDGSFRKAEDPKAAHERYEQIRSKREIDIDGDGVTDTFELTNEHSKDQRDTFVVWPGGKKSSAKPLVADGNYFNLADRVVGDIDGDGRDEFVAMTNVLDTSQKGAPTIEAYRFSILALTDEGGFEQTASHVRKIQDDGSSGFDLHPQLVDYDGDGDLDLVTLFEETIVVLPTDGDGFGEVREANPPREDGYMKGDLLGYTDADGDGRVDLLIEDDELVVYFGAKERDAFVEKGARYVIPEGEMAIGDVDGDGQTDVVVVTEESAFTVFGMEGGKFCAPKQKWE